MAVASWRSLRRRRRREAGPGTCGQRRHPRRPLRPSRGGRLAAGPSGVPRPELAGCWEERRAGGAAWASPTSVRLSEPAVGVAASDRARLVARWPLVRRLMHPFFGVHQNLPEMKPTAGPRGMLGRACKPGSSDFEGRCVCLCGMHRTENMFRRMRKEGPGPSRD